MSEQKKNYLDENAFKPLAKIEGGKTLRLRVSVWNNCLQLGTKIGNDFINLDITLDYFKLIAKKVRDLKGDERAKAFALNCKKGRDNQTYGMVAFGVGEDGVWYIGAQDTRGGKVKHLFLPNQKFAYIEDGQIVGDSEMSFLLFQSWFENITDMMPLVWREMFKTAEERAYKPGGQGQGNYNQPAAAPAISFDTEFSF